MDKLEKTLKIKKFLLKQHIESGRIDENYFRLGLDIIKIEKIIKRRGVAAVKRVNKELMLGNLMPIASSSSNPTLGISKADKGKVIYQLRKFPGVFTGHILIDYMTKLSEDYDVSRGSTLHFEANNLTYNQLLHEVKRRMEHHLEKFTGRISDSGTIKVQVGRHLKRPKTMFKSINIERSSFRKLPYNIASNSVVITHNCVDTYLEENAERLRIKVSFPKFKKSRINKEWDVVKLVKYFQTNQINYEIFNQWMKPYDKHVFNKNRQVNIFIIGNSHIYPLTMKEKIMLKSSISGQFEVDSYKELEAKTIVELYEVDSVVEHIHIQHDVNFTYDPIVSSYIIDKTIYLPKFDTEIIDAYKSMGLPIFNDSRLSIFTPLLNICDKYELYSTIVNEFKAPQSVYVYNSDNYDNHTCNLLKEECDCIDVIDKNKAYTSSFHRLDKVPVIRAENVEREYLEGEEIVKYNYYRITKVLDKRLIPFIPIGWHSGYRLMSHNTSDFTIDLVIEPTLVDNPFIKVIEDLMEINPDMVKHVFNKFIGLITRQYHNRGSKLVFDRILEEDEENEDGITFPMKDFYMAFKYGNVPNNFRKNMLPLAMYIVDNNVSMIWDKCVELDNLGASLIKINTDSISYVFEDSYDDNGQLNVKPTPAEVCTISKKLGDWKTEVFKMKEDNFYKTECPEIAQIKKITKITANCMDGSIYINCLAGAGKTYCVKNTLIPLIKQLGKTFIIICSQHSPLVEYQNVKKSTIAKSLLNSARGKNKLNTYDYVILEEASLTSTSEWDYLHSSFKGHLIVLGDMYQLIAPADNIRAQAKGIKLKKNPFGSVNIKAMFKYEMVIKGNRRNHYKRKEYLELIRGIISKRIQEDIDLRENVIASYNICYTNTKRREINAIISKDYKYKFGGMKLKIDARIICKTNRLMGLGLTNNMFLWVEGFDFSSGIEKLVVRDTETIKYDSEGKTNTTIYEIKLSQFIVKDGKLKGPDGKDRFWLGGAFTVYMAQGKSFRDVGYHQVDMIKKIPGGLYTMVSRLQTK